MLGMLMWALIIYCQYHSFQGTREVLNVQDVNRGRNPNFLGTLPCGKKQNNAGVFPTWVTPILGPKRALLVFTKTYHVW